jgi:CMP-N,N'-diacetyllegionaminic acid synthase
MRILGIIPARGGSKGVPGKNIKILGGKPLIWYTYEMANRTNLFSDIILSTEDEEIATIGKSLGMKVPFLRPKELAEDNTKSIDVILHCIQEQLKNGISYDIIVLLQPTSPFRDKFLMEKAMKIFKERNADSLVSVRKVPSHFNPHWLFERDEKKMLKIATGEKEIISRRQELPDAFYRDGQLYITSVDVLLKHHTFFGERLTYILNESEGSSINIDNMDDWYKAEEYISKNKIEY